MAHDGDHDEEQYDALKRSGRVHRPGQLPPYSLWVAHLPRPPRPLPHWTRKARGKTVGADELGLYREWIENNHWNGHRRISSRVLALHRQAGSMNPRGSGSPATVAVTFAYFLSSSVAFSDT